MFVFSEILREVYSFQKLCRLFAQEPDHKKQEADRQKSF